MTTVNDHSILARQLEQLEYATREHLYETGCDARRTRSTNGTGQDRTSCGTEIQTSRVTTIIPFIFYKHILFNLLDDPIHTAASRGWL